MIRKIRYSYKFLYSKPPPEGLGFSSPNFESSPSPYPVNYPGVATPNYHVLIFNVNESFYKMIPGQIKKGVGQGGILLKHLCPLLNLLGHHVIEIVDI